MQNFPIFTTQYGVASLILKEIPYRAEAYIRIQDVQPEDLSAHLQECVSFCRMAGADHVYAAGHEALEAYPLYCSVVEMRMQARVDREKLACLFPVTEQTAGKWREIYNRRMAAVSNAATLESRDEKKLHSSAGAYFVHREGKLLGIGWLEDTRLLAVAAAEKGSGDVVMNTLMSLVEGDDMTLEVASTNERAIRLYERLGFVKTREIARWHEV